LKMKEERAGNWRAIVAARTRRLLRGGRRFGWSNSVVNGDMAKKFGAFRGAQTGLKKAPGSPEG